MDGIWCCSRFSSVLRLSGLFCQLCQQGMTDDLGGFQDIIKLSYYSFWIEDHYFYHFFTVPYDMEMEFGIIQEYSDRSMIIVPHWNY